LVLVMNRSSNLAGKSYDFLMKKPDEKNRIWGMKKCGKILGRFFFSEFPKLPCLITKGQLEGSLSSGFSRGNQRKCWSRERRHWAQPVEKTCNPIFSSHDIWKGLQNRMLQIQFLRYVQDFPLLRSTKWTWLMASILWRSVWKSYTPLTKGSSEEFSAPLTRTSTLWLCQNSYW
jgi:hypothetical protein